MFFRKKWNMFGRQIFFLQFLQYLLFLVSITGYTLSKLTYDRFKAMNTKDTDALGERSLHLKPFISSDPVVVVFRYASFFTVGLGILIEISQVIRSKARYFNIRNLVDWLLYLLSIVFLLDLGLGWEEEEESKPLKEQETLGCSGATVIFFLEMFS